MRLEFGVLWFENQPQEVASQREEIEEIIEDHGYRPDVHLEVDGSNIDTLARDQEAFHRFDLVLVDFDLGGAEDGDVVAKRVRQRFGATDIIFYSAVPAVDLRQKVCDARLDGVYCASRQELVDRVDDQVEEVVRRASRLEGMRGLAMATVGRCDAMLREIACLAYQRLDEDGRHEIETKLDDFVISGADRLVAKYKSIEGFEARVRTSRAVTSMHLYKVCREVTRGLAGADGPREVGRRYGDDLLTPRNTLGHAREERGEDGWEVRSDDGTTITAEHFGDMRTRFGQQEAAVAELLDLLRRLHREVGDDLP